MKEKFLELLKSVNRDGMEDLIKFIENNTDSWEEKLNARLIRISRNGDLACFKYMAEADFSDPLVCEARGIMIDAVQLSVVCWPFDKLANATGGGCKR